MASVLCGLEILKSEFLFPNEGEGEGEGEGSREKVQRGNKQVGRK